MALTVPRIPTAGVVAVLKVPEIDSLLTRGESTSKVLTFAKDNEFILFDTAQNQIESFTHEVMSSEKGGLSKNVVVEVSLIDPTYKFESNLISVGFRAIYGTNNKVFEEIERLQSLRVLSDSAEANLIRSKLKKANEDLLGIQAKKDRDLANRARQESIGLTNAPRQVLEFLFPAATGPSKTDKKIRDLSNLVKVYESQLQAQIVNDNKDFFDKVQREINSLEADCTPGVYFFYGIGDKKDSWAGPVQCVLTAINYKYDGAGDMRTLNLRYVALDSLPTPTVEKLFYRGLNTTLTVDTELYTEFNGNTITNSLHISITNLLRKFISGAAKTNINNTLVLLPNLDHALKGYKDIMASSMKGALKLDDLMGLYKVGVEGLALIDGKTNERVLETLGFDVVVYSAFNVTKISVFSPISTELVPTDDSTNFGISLTIRNNETIKDVLQRVEEGVRDHSSIPIGRTEIFVENDPKVKQIYKQFFQIEGFDDNQPLVIYGDVNFILNYFYGFIGVEGAKEKSNSRLVAIQDQALLNNDRIIAMNNLFFTAEKRAGMFDNLFYQLPDDFAYTGDSKVKAKEDIGTLKTPVFIHGLQNSNVLSINTDMDLQYFNAITDTFKPNLADTVAVKSVGDASIFSKLQDLGSMAMSESNIEAIRSGLRNFTSTGNFKGDVKYIKMLYSANCDYLNEDLIQTLAEEFVTIYNSSKQGGRALNYNEYVRNALPNKILSLMRRISEFNLVATIKTLPFFRFYNVHNSLFFPAYLFMKEPLALGSPNKRQFLSQLLSGEWSIIGFKHHISEGEIYSQFTIIRNPNAMHSPHALLKKKELSEL